jgi:hypothetical protein
MALSVINRPIGAAMELNAIAKICKYKRFHENHHFILMAMEVHGALGQNMDCYNKEVWSSFP